MSWDAPAELVEERVDIGLRVEGDEVVDFFAGADEAYGEIEFAGDGDDDAAFGGAVELGQHDSGDASVAPEFAGLVEAILACGRVENEQDIVRRAGNNFSGGALHFFQLGHEIRFCVKAAGGVDDYDVGGARAGGGKRVEDDGGRISAGFLSYHLDAGAARPNFKLLDGGGAKRVGGAEDNASAFFFQAIAKFADGGGFASAIYADDENHARRNFRCVGRRAGRRCHPRVP